MLRVEALIELGVVEHGELLRHKLVLQMASELWLIVAISLFIRGVDGVLLSRRILNLLNLRDSLLLVGFRADLRGFPIAFELVGLCAFVG